MTDEEQKETNCTIKTNKEGAFQTPLGNFNLQTTTLENNGVCEKSCNIAVKKEIEKFTVDLDVEKNNNEIKHTENLSYNSGDEEFSVNADIKNANGTLSYETNVNGSLEFKHDISATAEFHKSINDTSVGIGVKKQLLNPDNIENTENQDKVKKEELIESGDKVSVQTKVGSSKENGLYTQNSVMFRIDNSNFLKTDYNTSENGHELNATADLKKIKLEYQNSQNNNIKEKTEITTNKVDALLKGEKNQFSSSFSNVKKVDANLNTTTTTEIGTSATFNRTEYKEFNEGLNGEIKTSISLNDGKFSGYNTSIDGAYNWYGYKHGKTTDFLIRSNTNFGKDEKNKNFETQLSTAYRINNCKTIFETYSDYSTNYSQESRVKELYGGVGIFQNVGKKHGDAVIYSKIMGGKNWENGVAKTFANVKLGANVKATKKVALDANMNYGSGGNFSGEIGGRYSF